MGWTTIYIQGKSGCSEEVLHNLEHSGIKFMPGSAFGEKNTLLFWVDEKLSMRDFKKAIGSKTVFKYRLRFFTNLEKVHAFNEPDLETLTPQEESLLRQIRLDDAQHHYKYTA